MAKEIEQTNPYHVSETRRDPNTGELVTEHTAAEKSVQNNDSFDITEHA